MASMFKQMGTDNHLFILALHDTDLLGIDPHDPGISTLMKAKVTVECKVNPWYYLREVAMVPGISGDEIRLVNANRSIISLWWLFFNHITNFLIQPRQTGKSFGLDQLTNLLCEIRCKKTEINLLTKDDTLRGKTIARIKAINATLPYYLRHQSKEDARNHKEFTVKALGNYFTAHLPSNSPKRADAIGRGFSSGINQNDEGPFCPNSHITVPSMLQAANAAREAAKRAGEPYGNIFTTTAGARNSKEGKFFYKQLMASAEWTEAFYDTDDLEDLEKVIRLNSRSAETGRGRLQVNSTFSYKQLGKSREWMIDAIENSLGDKDSIRKDLFNEWIDASATSPLSHSVLRMILNSKKEPLYTEVSDHGYIIKWYIPESEVADRTSRAFIMALDSSEGLGDENDDCGLVFRDPLTGETLATGVYNTLNITEFTNWLFSLFEKYPHMVGIIERKSTGVAILDQLCLQMNQARINPFKRLFNMVVDEQTGQHKDKFERVENSYGKGIYTNYLTTLYKRYLGFTTVGGNGTTSRNKLYGETLNEATKHTGHLVYDQVLSNQITGLRVKNGRIDHSDDDHDDLALAWCLSYFILHRAQHISYYGLDSISVLKDLPKKPGAVEMSPTEKEHQHKQKKYMQEVNRLKAAYGTTKVSAIRNRIEARIRFIAAKIEHSDNVIFNVDQVISSMKGNQLVKKRRLGIYRHNMPKKSKFLADINKVSR